MMRRTLSAVLLLASILMAWMGATGPTAWADDAADVEYFEKHVRPLLEERCLDCHGSESDPMGGNLRVDYRQGLLDGGDLGPAIVPGKPEQSLLMRAVSYTDAALQMPPDGKLSSQDRAVLQEWIRRGAPDPRTQDPRDDSASPSNSHFVDWESARAVWSLQSPHAEPISVPTVHDSSWPDNEIDRFVLAELEANQLRPNPPADKRTLIRRATYDLTGLPPTPAELQAFLQDTAPDAYERLVERLLASPRYGERWGRFWLDVARYADSNGLDENIAHGNAWRYRDYVVRSWNHDKSYRRFVLEQLAGDLLVQDASQDASQDAAMDDAQRTDCFIATGFLSLGPKVLAEVDETKMEMDIIDEQIDTVGRALMGLTLGCARCHDHKFDPIRTRDYYALAGIFKSTRTMEHFTKIAKWNEVDLASPAQQTRRQEIVAQLAARQAELKAIVETIGAATAGGSSTECTGPLSLAEAEKRKAALEQEIEHLQADLPAEQTAMAVTERDERQDVRVHIRGSHLTQGDLVPRGVPEVFGAETSSHPSIPSDESGRIQLAQWLVNGQHPLVARVMVNRIWRWHFGRGLVSSTDNFGNLGSSPSNQPLLDWLAQQFVDDQWSIKSLHRQIMLSRVYQMSSDDDAAKQTVDPENHLWWRTEPRRLEAEAIRDAMLWVSNTLDQRMGGSLLHVGNREFFFDHTSKDTTNYDSPRRSLYLPVVRNHLYDLFQLFDYTDASVTNSNRPTTTVPTQALFLMNSQLVHDSAAGFARRIIEQHSAAGNVDASKNASIDAAYEIAFGRMPTDAERQAACSAVTGFEAVVQQDDTRPEPEIVRQLAWQMFCHSLLMSNEFIYVR
jgi:uncharacterized small protein (DUF1192 family)